VAGAGLDVKCAGCRSYYRLDQVKLDKNAYYCRTCYEIHKSNERSRIAEATNCPVCSRELTPYDQAIKEGGFSYCPACYDRVAGEGRGQEEAGRESRCSACGNALNRYEIRVLYGSNSYCLSCYDRRTPYLDPKPFGLQPGESIASMRTGEKVVCLKCRRDLGPMDVKFRDGVTIYCESCYREARGASGKHQFHVAEQAGINIRPGPTALRNPGDLVECGNCGYVITRDRLETFPKDARGKLRCPHCEKKFVPVFLKGPGKAKEEKPKPEKPGKEDFALTAQLFKCLGDPCRVKIIESLSEKELCVFEFVDLTGFQYSAVSYHLKMLKEMDLVRSFERGNFMVYSLTEKGQIVHEFIAKSLECNGEVWLSRATRNSK
jgi:ArsR family transcriptional regulator